MRKTSLLYNKGGGRLLGSSGDNVKKLGRQREQLPHRGSPDSTRRRARMREGEHGMQGK